jgi:hypothetical protein
MALRELEYQARVLARFDEYLTELAAQKAKADKIAAANAGETDPDLIRDVPNFAAKTWRALNGQGLPGQCASADPPRRGHGRGPERRLGTGLQDPVRLQPLLWSPTSCRTPGLPATFDGTEVVCDLVHLTEWKTRLPELIA